MFKWLFKWIFRLAILIVVLVVLLIAFKDSIWTALAEHRIRSETGLEARIGKLSTGILSPVVTIEDLKLYNTAEFGGTLFLEVPELHIEVDSLAFAQRKLKMKLVRFNLATINIVRNEAGLTNILVLVESEKKQREKKKKDSVQRLLGDLEFDGIDVLNLSLGKATFTDLGNPKNNTEIAVNMENQLFRNVKSEGDAYGILFMIWLRSGGKLSISPNNLAREYFEQKVNEIESNVRQRVNGNPPPGQK
jgi:hypothetical protein